MTKYLFCGIFYFMSLPVPEKIPVSELDRFEWLALEALWGTAKSPYETQWERWQSQKFVSDPDATTGLVVGGNLSRVHVNLRNADLLAVDGQPDRDCLSMAAEHLGKMAGGIVGIATHFRTSPDRWNDPLASHITDHLEVTEGVLAIAAKGETTSLEAGDYYALLAPVLDATKATGSKEIAAEQKGRLLRVAGLAVRSWEQFLDSHDAIEIVPGATPRSTGQFIEDLRADFEQYVPTVQSAARARH